MTETDLSDDREAVPAGVVPRSLPPFDDEGFLPPHEGERMVRMGSCAPYRISLETLTQRFGTTPRRLELCEGLRKHRAALHELGIVTGFQWVGGSFLTVSEREPSDIDVVTFFAAPPALATRDALQELSRARPDVFLPTRARETFGVDAYFVRLKMSHQTFRSLTLWYALFSHDRPTGRWKGFVELGLAP